jgi:hypothetical protein
LAAQHGTLAIDAPVLTFDRHFDRVPAVRVLDSLARARLPLGVAAFERRENVALRR